MGTPPFTSVSLSPARVLLVEDDVIVALDAEDTLTRSGYVVVATAASAADAIRYAGSDLPKLMDIRLIGARDGVDVAVEIYQRLGIRSLFASAHDDSHTRERAEPACPLGWLRKPYTPSELLAPVSAALGAAITN